MTIFNRRVSLSPIYYVTHIYSIQFAMKQSLAEFIGATIHVNNMHSYEAIGNTAIDTYYF